MDNGHPQTTIKTIDLLAPSATSEPSSALVMIDKIMKSFGPKVTIKNVSFSVPSGQICGLLGPNGAGKTTLFRLLMGILKATEGKLLIAGHDAFEDRVQVKRFIGFLPDEPRVGRMAGSNRQCSFLCDLPSCSIVAACWIARRC